LSIIPVSAHTSHHFECLTPTFVKKKVWSHLATAKMHVSWQIDWISFPVLQSLRSFMVHHFDIPVLNHKAQIMRGSFFKPKKGTYFNVCHINLFSNKHTQFHSTILHPVLWSLKNLIGHKFHMPILNHKAEKSWIGTTL